jgi:hypothetical protein
MKKLSYIILGIVIGALATYYFCPRTIKNEESGIKIVKPKGVITPLQAKGLSDNWTTERKRANDSAAKKHGREVDDRSAWWSLEDIENYIIYAKDQSNTLGYDMTGIRVYLGVYGTNTGQTKKNLTTMFMVPTGKELQETATSTFGLTLLPSINDVPGGDPLNDGQGGQGGYPQ